MVKGHPFVREVADDQALPAGVVVVGRVGAHPGAYGARFAVRYASSNGDIRKGAVVIVVVKLVGLGVVGHEKVQPAIVVVVEQGHTQRFAGGIVEAGAPGYVFKSSVAPIVKERRAFAFVGLRRAVGFILIVERAVLVGRDGPVDVVSNEEIELAVVVIVEPHRPGGKSGIGYASLGGYVGELAIAQVAKKMVGADRRDVDIDVAIVVIVSDRAA